MKRTLFAVLKDRAAVFALAVISLCLGFSAAVSYHDPMKEVFRNFSNSRVYFITLAFSAVIFLLLSMLAKEKTFSPAYAAAAAVSTVPFSILKHVNFYYAMAGSVSLALTLLFLHSSFLKNRSENKLPDKQGLLPALYALCSLSAAISFFHSLSSHYAFHTKTYDTAFYENTVWLFSRLKESYTLTGYMGLTHDFGMHFEPVLYLVASFYRLLPSTEMLYFIQAVCLFSSPVLLFLLARKITKNELLSFILACAFCLSPYLFKTADWDFHPMTIYPLAVLGFLYFAESRRFLLSCLFFVFAASVKEETPVYLFFITIFLALRLDDRRYYILSALSAAWAVAAIKLIIPSLSSMNFTMGDVPLDAFNSLPAIVTPSMLVQLAVILASTAFIAFISLPAFFLIAAPAMLLHIMNYRETWHSSLFFLHYSAAVIPGLFAAVIYGFEKIKTFPLFKQTGVLVPAFYILFSQVFIFIAFYPSPTKPLALFSLILIFAAAPAAFLLNGKLRYYAVIASLLLALLPGYMSANGWRYRTPEGRALSLKKALSFIPVNPETPVMAMEHLTSQLSRRTSIMTLSPHMLTFAETPQQIMIVPVMRGFSPLYLIGEKQGDDFLRHWDFSGHYKVYQGILALMPKLGYKLTTVYSDDWAEVIKAEK